jgi:hypothetical protein
MIRTRSRRSVRTLSCDERAPVTHHEIGSRGLRRKITPMNIFFDVDYTILGYDGSIRPSTRDVFDTLDGAGHAVFIWSGVGVRRNEVTRFNLQTVVQGVYQKPLEDFDAGLTKYNIPVVPDFVIDDDHEIVTHFGGHLIRPYVSSGRPDRELLAIPDLVAAYLENRQRAH